MEGARPSSVRIGCSEALHHGGGSRTAHAQNLSPDGMVASVPVDAANSRREGKAIGPGSCIRGGDDGEHGSNVYQGVPSKFRGKRRRDTDEAGHLAGASSSTPSGTRKAGHRGVDQYGTQQQQQQQQQCMLPLPRGGDFSSGGVVLPDDSCRHCSANHDERMRRCTGAAAKANPGCTSAASTRGDCSSSCTVGRFHGQALPECGRISPDTTTAQEPGSSRRTGDISATITLSGRNPFPPPGAAASDRRQKPGTAGVEATTTTRCASSTPWDAHVSMPSSSDQETTTVHATDIASVLKLDHGARSDAAMSTARLDEAATTVGDAGQRGKLKKALVGVLTFESLREGALALSSLFLKDETGD